MALRVSLPATASSPVTWPKHDLGPLAAAVLRPRRQAALFHTTRPLGIQDETVDRLEEAKERYQKYRQFIREVAMPNFRLPPKPSTDSESSQGQDGDGQSRSSKPVYVGRGGSSPLAGESGSDVGKGTSSTSPFPLNPAFRSEEVLGDAARETIWQRVAVKGDPIKVVSAELGVDVRRVAAVVRLKEIERQWTREGKPLMHAYANAMWSMLPTRDHLTPPSSRSADPLTSAAPFEPTNDLHVHRLTHPQLFVPVPESKPFTRVDAAREFHPSLLPADARVPLAGLVEAEREALRLRQSGPSATKGRRDGTGTSEVDVEALRARFWEREREEERLAAEREAKEREARERRITRVVVGGEDASIGESESADATATGRKHRRPVEYRFEEIRVEDGGRFGRSRKGTGMRYGVPFDDRKKGKVKIPTSVG